MEKGESAYRSFLDGDEEALRELIGLYRDNLIFFINRYVHNLTAAEDISEDVFVELLLHPRRYNFKTPLKTYLFTIARNKAVSFIRKQSHLTDMPEGFEENRADCIALEDEFVKRENERLLHLALNSLNEDYRTVLHLIYFENMSYAEAGRVMKKSEKQITNLVYRAKKALKESDFFED